MRLISQEQVTNENLWFTEYVLRTDPNGARQTRFRIIDANNNEYDAVVDTNGTVYTGDGQVSLRWDSVETYQHWHAGRPDDATRAEKLMTWHAHKWVWELIRDPNGEIYIVEDYHGGDYRVCISRITSVQELAEIVFHTFGEHVILDLPRSGHMAVHVPADIRDALRQLASDKHMSPRDLIVERLASTDEIQNADARAKEVKAWLAEVNDWNENDNSKGNDNG